MTIREILTIPDPRLRKVSAPVTQVDDGVRELIVDLFATMYDAPGIGLAAVQVGVLRRILVIDVAKEPDEKEPHTLINPEIVAWSDEIGVHEEGCLSIPDYFEEVERPAGCTVTYLDREGKRCEMECEGLLATVVQHEVDHLDGKLFIDYLSRLKRERITKKFTKQAKRAS
ncbi:MAG: peptide deformylase [Alphaproteobacteria bacterium]|nr:peptide deformylase [Alphaproteobacteria bacterium]